MSTNVGYVDITYADTYVEQHFLSTESIRTSWEMLDDPDKEVLLRRSFEAIEALPYQGRKTDRSQVTVFPRYPDKEVPSAIKDAQIENALMYSDTSVTEEAAFYEKMRRFGIQSYSVGNLTESLGSGAWGSSFPAAAGIVSSRAFRLLQPYIQGSYQIKGACR